MGMATTWTLAGSAVAYSGNLTTTDGYYIEAAMTMVTFTSTNTGGAATCTNNACVIGTCVETYDSAGVVVASTVTDDGNLALCHWFLIALNSIPGTSTVVSGTTNDYSVAYYLTAVQWGTAGNALVGNGLATRGTVIGTTQEFTRTPSTKPTDVFTAGTYKQKWFQPKYAATYSASALRRYNGGSSDGDNVKAYCAEQRDIATTSTTFEAGNALVPATVAGTAGVV
jgi:hypothetical protein